MTVGRVTSPPAEIPSIALRFIARPGAAPFARRQIVDFGVRNGAGKELAARIALAVSEAVSNAIRHAYPSEAGPVECDADIEDGLLEVVVRDRGAGFRATSTPGLGAGLAIIADCCDDFTIAQHDHSGVEVWMRFLMTAA